MAEGVVSFAVQNLTDLLTQEVGFLSGVRGQVEQLRNELRWIQSFLKDADAKQEVDERVHQWVSEIRDIAYDAEDIIDNYILQIEEKKVVPLWKGVMTTLKNGMTCICKGIELHKIGKDIETIQKRLHDISAKREIYGIQKLGEVGEGSSTLSEKLRNSRRSSPYGEEEDIIGLDDTVEVLVTQLIGDELRRSVTSIVGMGGLGKTSLAKKIYNHILIKTQFHHRAWVYVSQKFNIVDLLRKIIKSFTMPSRDDLEMMEKLNEEDLERWLFNLLEQKRYLVVLDDVWEPEAWESLKRAFPENLKGSRVLLTTRIGNVALSADQKFPPHHLRFLTEEESWELFCRKAFPNNGGLNFCLPVLEKLGRKMVEKCNGLPLGIVILGGLLSKKQPPSVSEWQRVLNCISQNLMKDNHDRISQILSLSYNDLPYQLKFCFLHMGFYPEDMVIDTEKLIRLWVAEGFIAQGEEPMEDIAENYLIELIDRSMIQVENKNWRGVVACRIHDLLRDLSIVKAKEESFLDIIGKVDDTSLSAISRRQRRLPIHFEINRFVSLNHCPFPYLRSLIFFNINKETIQLEQFRSIYTNFKLLKVLDLDDTPQAHPLSLPNSIGEMIHLRYLGLQGMNLKDLPASIENLQRLQTLKTSNFYLCMVPNVMWEMKQLRHIQGNWVTDCFKIDTLTNLQTLGVNIGNALIRNSLTNLTNLRHLEVSVDVSYADVLAASLSQLRSLQSLHLMSTVGPILLESLKCYHLLSLTLVGPVERLPNSLQESCPNLTEISLRGCELKEDPMATLERLPNLVEVTIDKNGYIGKEMICLARGFPRLESLSLFLHDLEEWRVEEEAMPRLKTLMIITCEKLKEVPDGLKFLTTLCKLEFKWMLKEFEDKLRGVDSYKVQHVHSVTFI